MSSQSREANKESARLLAIGVLSFIVGLLVIALFMVLL